MTVETRPRRRRQRWPEVLIGVLCLALAGWLTNNTELHQDKPIRHRVGAPAVISGSGQELRVNAVELTTRLAAEDGSRYSERPPLTTAGVFVVLRLELRTPHEARIERLHCTLSDGEREATPTIGTAQVVAPSPGFRQYQDLVFERSVDSVVGTALWCRPTESIVAFRAVHVFDLGLTDAMVDDARHRDTEVGVRQSPDVEVIP